MSTAIQPPRGLFLGAALMYLLDPDRGRRRRALLADKARKIGRKSGRGLRVAAHDLENRARGALLQVGIGRERDGVDDGRLEARIRTRLGRVCSHPHAIHVEVDRGVATVSGPVLLDEWRRVRKVIRTTRDLRGIDDRLEIHTVPDVPRLAGGHRRGRSVGELLGGPWTPATRLVVGALGVGTVVSAAGLRGWQRRIALGAGVTMLAGSVVREIRSRRQPAGAQAQEIDLEPARYDELEEITGEFEYMS